MFKNITKFLQISSLKIKSENYKSGQIIISSSCHTVAVVTVLIKGDVTAKGSLPQKLKEILNRRR